MIEILLLAVVLIILMVLGLYYLIGAIMPTPIQIQLLGIHFTLLGGFLLLNGSQTISFLIMVVGLIVGVFGCFRSPNPSNDKND